MWAPGRGDMGRLVHRLGGNFGPVGVWDGSGKSFRIA